MTRRIVPSLLVFLALLSCSRDAVAHPRSASEPYVVTVESEGGRELPTFHHQGQTFVLGQYGERYNIRVQNHTGRRIEAVITVDGRDVVSGRVGDFMRERGYLVDAYDDLTIEGFRQSWDAVAAFRFTSPGNSYSSQMGTPQNVGIIGVAIFPERSYHRPRPTPRPYSRYEDDYRYRHKSAGSDRASRPASAEPNAELRTSDGLGTGRGQASPPAPSSAPAQRAERSSGGARYDASEAEAPARNRDNLGTEYGEDLQSSAYETTFVRADAMQPVQLITLRYDDRAGLISRGILFERREPPVSYGPSAFPQNRFAPPPPQW